MFVWNFSESAEAPPNLLITFFFPCTSLPAKGCAVCCVQSTAPQPPAHSREHHRHRHRTRWYPELQLWEKAKRNQSSSQKGFPPKNRQQLSCKTYAFWDAWAVVPSNISYEWGRLKEKCLGKKYSRFISSILPHREISQLYENVADKASPL